MKILFVVYGSIDSQSGGYLYDRALIHTLEKRGHKVLVLSQAPGACYLCHIFDNFNSTFLKSAVDFAPDLVIEDELNHPSLFFINRKLKNSLRVPIVGMVHHLRQVEQNGVFLSLAARLMEHAFLESLDGYICNSDFTLRTIRAALGKKPDDILPVPHVVSLPGKDRLAASGQSSPDEKRTMSPHPDTLRILFLGNVIRRKGLHVLVRALGRMSGTAGSTTGSTAGSTSWSLSIAGNKEADPRYTRLIEKELALHGLEGRVSWLGHVDDKALQLLFSTHDVLAVPSQCEGFGIVYAEAMKSGMPVIAGSYGGAPEMITHGENGYLADWEDDKSLAGFLSALIDDPSLPAKLGSMAMQRAANLPGWEDSMAKASAFLESLV